MNLIPMFDRVLVHKKEYVDPDAVESDVIQPDSAKEEPVTGVVVAAGEGRILPDGTIRPLSVKVGDWVLFGRYSGEDLSWRLLKDHALIREDEVLSKIE
jgi:chaperonin GroES